MHNPFAIFCGEENKKISKMAAATVSRVPVAQRNANLTGKGETYRAQSKEKDVRMSNIVAAKGESFISKRSK